MNGKYDEVNGWSDTIRRRSHKLYTDLGLNKKPFLWVESKKMGLVVQWGNLKHLDENLFLNIPFPLKQQRRKI